jgi:hypothetical protein
MRHRSPLFGGTPGLEPVALRIARINEDLAELQELHQMQLANTTFIKPQSHKVLATKFLPCVLPLPLIAGHAGGCHARYGFPAGDHLQPYFWV